MIRQLTVVDGRSSREDIMVKLISIATGRNIKKALGNFIESSGLETKTYFCCLLKQSYQKVQKLLYRCGLPPIVTFTQADTLIFILITNFPNTRFMSLDIWLVIAIGVVLVSLLLSLNIFRTLV